MNLKKPKKKMKVSLAHLSILNMIMIEMGGTYDYFNEKDRWQFLSKEIQQK